jgi:hypothetical protein
MKNGQFGVGERVEDALVIRPGISLVIRHGAGLVFRIENADERPEAPMFLIYRIWLILDCVIASNAVCQPSGFYC